MLEKLHMLACAQTPRVNVLNNYASARQFFARWHLTLFQERIIRLSQGLIENIQWQRQPIKSEREL